MINKTDNIQYFYILVQSQNAEIHRDVFLLLITNFYEIKN